ncbi:DUF883 family protein [Pollutimonas thiosulfatoxidans]|uniref:DUF883 domain-containing protein n=1 Tax=Pollutimonas thiosulfatoxidans TaxID=2028345 RepID=A0A410GB14_9BURK|nr:DUF883 family protein [Pollutimonas thiosulfatoxidans]MBF6616279.1 DUF883 domain-containing protein [Candidimonas sp.]NYT45937.1 DUF883 domain-containing protein [Alcaligenaceae bacterium]QAA93481.1 hypothetical protein CKA81_06235 [Pollutimonas thiosulfatoxidans]
MNAEQDRAEMDRQKERVAFDMSELVAGTEALLRATASYTGAEIEVARERLRAQLDSAKEQAQRWNGLAREKVQHATYAVDEYAHEHPWRMLAVAGAVGVVVGHCLLGNKRR